jgi:hypothetical protein
MAWLFVMPAWMPPKAGKEIGQDAREEDVVEVRNVGNLRNRRVVAAEVFELTGRGVPVHTGARIDKVVERHDIALCEQIPPQPSDVRGFDKQAGRQFPPVREVPTEVARQAGRLINGLLDPLLAVIRLAQRETQLGWRVDAGEIAEALPLRGKERGKGRAGQPELRKGCLLLLHEAQGVELVKLHGNLLPEVVVGQGKTGAKDRLLAAAKELTPRSLL